MSPFSRWLLLSPLLLVLTGCWSAVGINNRAMVAALAIDPGKDHTFKVTAQVISPEGASSSQSGGDSGGGSGANKVVSASGEGDTLLEALVPVRSQLAKDLYLPVVQVVVLSPTLPPGALNQAVVEMMRIPTIDPTVLMVMAQGASAAKLLDTKPLTTPSTMADIHAAFTGVRRQDTLRVQLWQHFRSVMSPDDALFLPAASITDGHLQLRGFALLSGGKVVGFIRDSTDIHVFPMLAGRLRKGFYSVRDAKGRAFGLQVSHAVVRRRYIATPSPHFAVDVRLSTMLTAAPGPTTQADLDALSQTVAEQFTAQGTDLLSRLQAGGADPFKLTQTYVYSQHVIATRSELQSLYKRTPIELHVGVQTVSRGVVT